MITRVKNAYIVLILPHSGTAQSAQNAPSKPLSGTESIVITVHQTPTGISIYQNASHVPPAKFTVQLKTNVFAQSKHLICWQTEPVSSVHNPTTGMTETVNALPVDKE